MGRRDTAARAANAAGAKAPAATTPPAETKPLSVPDIRLDRSLPYQPVYGEGARCAFRQHGLPFDTEGRIIKDQVTPALMDGYRKTKGQKVKPEPKEEPLPADTNEVNLAEWLTGATRYTPQQVQAAVKSRFGINKRNLQEIAEELVAKQVVRRDEVSPRILPPATGEGE